MTEVTTLLGVTAATFAPAILMLAGLTGALWLMGKVCNCAERDRESDSR